MNLRSTTLLYLHSYTHFKSVFTTNLKQLVFKSLNLTLKVYSALIIEYIIFIEKRI